MISFFNNLLSNFIDSIVQRTTLFLENVTLADFSIWKISLDILLVATVFYIILKWFQGSRAVNMLIGILIVGFAFSISKFLDLEGLSTLLSSFLIMLLITVPIVFQQELRRGLERLGQTPLLSLTLNETGIKGMIKNVVKSSELLAKKQHGALIVIERQIGLLEYAETGVILKAKVSKELLLNIFFPKSPLHDGAVIIQGDKIFSAGSVLPISHKTYDYFFGTRHKAALGLSELTDALVIVISEERGEISFVSDGLIQRNISVNRLEKILEELLIVPKKRPKFKKLLKKK